MPSVLLLPELILLEDYGGSWEKYVEAVYEKFCSDFVRSKPTFPGKRVALKRHPVVQDKEATFWHFTSEGSDEAERIPDLRRCERIGWPRALIEAYGTDKVCCWEAERNKEIRHHIALTDFSYLVVVADRGEYVLPWTAFPVQREHQRQKLKKQYDDWVKSKGKKS